MVFRRNEEIENGLERALRYLIPKELGPEEQKQLQSFIEDLSIRLGPVVDSYPSWHPLVCNHNSASPSNYPSEQCGYLGLDHTVCFANGFISCPYHDGQKIIDSVEVLSNNDKYWRYSHVASIECERIEKRLYNDNTDPILVFVKWLKPINIDKTIPKSIAIGLMLEEEVPYWRKSEVGETWDTMRPYLMGQPCGKRSSIFLDQETGQAMKKMYQTMAYSGMYGPLKV